jgi:hypothetical protein
VAGRLDLLLHDPNPDTPRRYEVEIQLGKTDESHIIRTIEYWDLERKRYPQYERTAVIVAEDITSRFLNVISLFNGFIPLVALRLQAIRVDDRIGLVFTTVLNQIQLGLVDEDEEVQQVADRAYWERRASKETLRAVDDLVDILRSFAPGHELKYNRSKSVSHATASRTTLSSSVHVRQWFGLSQRCRRRMTRTKRSTKQGWTSTDGFAVTASP